MNFIKSWIINLIGSKVGLKKDTEETMDTKKWWTSKTILSDILTIVIAIVTVYDKISGSNLMSAEVTGSILAIAGALGIYGRKTADTKIG